MENIDTYLIFEDERILPSNSPHNPEHYGVFGSGPDAAAQYSFGPTLEQQLNGLGRGYSSSVTDFGSEVVVTIKYNNVKTGNSASATLLIKFNTPKMGVVKSNTVRYRSFTSHSEILQYIRARASALKQKTANNG